MKLNLKRPIIFFDLETTGVDTARDRIVEISMVKVMPDGEEITKTRRLNPGMHIPEEASAIHGITDDDVRDCPTFAQWRTFLSSLVMCVMQISWFRSSFCLRSFAGTTGTVVTVTPFCVVVSARTFS